MQGLTVNGVVSRGEVVFREKPFLQLLCRRFKDVACESCFEKAADLKPCKKCLRAKYCGKDCKDKQKEGHQRECQKLINLPAGDSALADRVRLIGNIFLMIKDKDWKAIESNILGTKISFDDIDPRSEEITNNDLRRLRYVWEKEHVRKFIGDRNITDNERFEEIFGKVVNNTCITETGKSGCESICFSIGLTAVQNECIPNCNVYGNGKTLMIWAVKQIKQSMKLSVHKERFFDFPQQIEALTGPCKCLGCSSSDTQSALSTIVDEKLAFGVIIETQQFFSMLSFYPVALRIPFMKSAVDDLLSRQKKVLGSQNALYLKLLAFKCLEMDGHPEEILKNLLELEQITVNTFGALFSPLKRIYRKLHEVYTDLENESERKKYPTKIKAIEDVENSV